MHTHFSIAFPDPEQKDLEFPLHQTYRLCQESHVTLIFDPLHMHCDVILFKPHVLITTKGERTYYNGRLVEKHPSPWLRTLLTMARGFLFIKPDAEDKAILHHLLCGHPSWVVEIEGYDYTELGHPKLEDHLQQKGLREDMLLVGTRDYKLIHRDGEAKVCMAPNFESTKQAFGDVFEGVFN